MNFFRICACSILLLLFATQNPVDAQIIIGGTIGNGNFEAGGGLDQQSFAQTPNWFNASGDESLFYTNRIQTEGSSDPGSRAGIPAGVVAPIPPRFNVNDTGWTVVEAGETFDLSYDFGRTTGSWGNEESFRAYLFTTNVAVDGNFTKDDINEVVETVYDVPVSNLPFWSNGITFDAFYETTSSDVGKTFYFGTEMLNPIGLPVYPRVDSIVLQVNSPMVSTVPGASKFLDGFALGGELADVYESDDVHWELEPSPTSNPVKQRIDLILLSESPVGVPSSFKFNLEAGMLGGPSGDVIQIIELWNVDESLWEVVDNRPATTSDSVVDVIANGDLTRFIQPITDEIIARISWASPTFAGKSFSWSVDVDQAAWIIE